jgi:hypothetical protein
MRVEVAATDQQRWFTAVMIGGVITAAILAVVGGFPIDMPMTTHQFGWVSPTCGLTRGSTAIARGDVATAWRYNPASFAVMGLGLVGTGRAVVGVVTGKWVTVSARPGWRTWAVFGAATLALWAHQLTNAEFIINARI